MRHNAEYQFLILIGSMVIHPNSQKVAINDIRQDQARILKSIHLENTQFLSSLLGSIQSSSPKSLFHCHCHNVFLSTDQIELTILQEHSRCPGTIISSPGPMGLLISSILSYSPVIHIPSYHKRVIVVLDQLPCCLAAFLVEQIFISMFVQLYLVLKVIIDSLRDSQILTTHTHTIYIYIVYTIYIYIIH